MRRPEDVLQPDHKASHHRVTAPGVTGHFYLETADPQAPRWMTFLTGELKPEPTPPANVSSAGVLFIRAHDRWFAFTFGHGRFLLRPERCERDFGLKVTINSVDPEQLRSVDLRTLEENSLHTRRQTSRNSPLEMFGVDPARDMLRAVTGQPRDASLGTRLTGAGPLAFALPVSVEDLPQLCGKLLPLYSRKDYQDRFGWIDEFETVNEAEIPRLDTLLVARLNQGGDGIYIAPPEAVDWSRLAGFIYAIDPDAPSVEEVATGEYLQARRNAGLGPLTAQSLTEEQLWAIATDGTRLERWSIYQTLLFEIDQHGHRYVLAAGVWYLVDGQFARMIDGYLAKVKDAKHLALPTYHHADEKAYNAEAAEALATRRRQVALLDRQTVRWTGNKTSIEFCDVLTSSGDFIHVKRETAATHISHLLNQGLVGGECFIQEELCREAVRTKIESLAQPRAKEKLLAHFTAARPDATKYKVIYAVIASTVQPLPNGLSFFSKVAMMNAVRRLFALGYEVHMCRVPFGPAAH